MPKFQEGDFASLDSKILQVQFCPHLDVVNFCRACICCGFCRFCKIYISIPEKDEEEEALPESDAGAEQENREAIANSLQQLAKT